MRGLEAQGGVLPSLRLECPCDLGAVRLASLQVRTFLLARGLSEEVVAGLELALVEAANNAVEHSTGEARELPIRIDATVGWQEKIELRICDHTPGFDWPDQAGLPDDESEGGRGLFLIQALVDNAVYLRARGENCLILTKTHKVRGEVKAVDAATEPALQAQLVDLEQMLDGMTEELSYSYETLTSIFSYSTQLASSQDLNSFAGRLLRDALVHAEADFSVLRLFDSEHGTLQVQHAEPAAKLAEIRLQDPISREAEAARSRQDAWFDQARPLAKEDALNQLGHVRIGVCHPLALNDQLLGTLTLARIDRDTPFRAAQINLLHTFADFLAIQIANERFLQERMKTQVMRRELDIAAGIQRSLAADAAFPSAAPFSMSLTCCESACDVGGTIFSMSSQWMTAGCSS